MQNEDAASRMVGDAIGLGLILSIIFSITLLGVAGFFFLRVMAARIGAKPGSTFQEKANAAFHAADLGWLALVCGPSLAFVISVVIVPQLLREHEITPLGVVPWLLLMTGVGLVAGAILAGAFWTTSALLGKVRKASKSPRSMFDPDFDGPV